MADLYSNKFLPKSPHVEDKRHKESIFIAADSFRRQRAFTDVVILIKDVEFHAHRLILAGSSPVLEAMLTADMREKKEGRISLSDWDIKPSTMEELLEYMYSGSIKLTIDNVEDLLSASSYLMMSYLSQFCCDFLKKILTPINCLGIREIAEKYGCSSLMERADMILNEEFISVMNSEEFLLLTKEDLVEILCKDTIQISSEDEVLESLYRWVNHKPDQRKNFFPEILKSVRLQFLSDNALETLMMKNTHTGHQGELEALLTEAVLAKVAKNQNGELLQVGSYLKPRNCLNKRKVVFSCGGYDGTKCMQTSFAFIPEDKKFCHLTSMKIARQDHALAEVDGVVYVVGGFNSHQGPLDSTECYNPIRNKWYPQCSMNTKRKSLGVAALNGKLFATGGLDGDYSSLDTTEVFDPQRNMWQFSGNMNEARYAHSLVSDDDHIYAIGGWQLSSMERYEPEYSQWVQLPWMSSARAGATAELINRKIYMVGGYGNEGCLNSVEVYNVDENKWNSLSEASISRWRASSCLVGDKLYVIGGRDSNWQYLDCIESFDVTEQNWKPGGPFYAKLMGMKCCQLELPAGLFK